MEDRFDYVFSYWLFGWWVLYALRWTRYSPKLWMWGGVAVELILFTLMAAYGYPLSFMVLFVLVNLGIKGWPLWTMRREKAWEFWPGLGLFAMYLGWISVNGESITGRAARHYEKLKEGKPFTPAISHLLQKINVSPRLLF